MQLPALKQDAIREQLDRVLASRQFRKSKRFPQLLRYTVEQALSEHTDKLNERTIGTEVFGRDLNYDTSLDPIVRMAAAEVRKRLAQYYYETPGHGNEIHIGFPRGSYVPQFNLPGNSDTLPTPQPEASFPTLPVETSPSNRWRWLLPILLSCIVVSSSVLWRFPEQTNSLNEFWTPLTSSQSPILLCVPDLDAVSPPSLNPPPPSALTGQVKALPAWFRHERVSFGDSLALATLTGLFGHEDHVFRIRRTDDAKLEDLREGPVVLIGGRSNQWAVELNKELRFGFIRDGDIRYISDSQNPSSRLWSVRGDTHTAGSTVAEDYALISRVIDPTTGHLLVTVAGVLQYGTEAAAQCLVDQACLAQAERLAPGDWKHKNIQIVVGTPIIGENSGQPSPLSAYLW